MADFYDIDNSFVLDARGDIALKTDGDAISQSIRHIILSQPGVKPGFGTVNLNFGVGVNSFLFAPLTSFTAKVFAETILRQLSIFESRIKIKNVDVQAVVSKRLFEITVTYTALKASDVQVFRTIINQI